MVCVSIHAAASVSPRKASFPTAYKAEGNRGLTAEAENDAGRA